VSNPAPEVPQDPKDKRFPILEELLENDAETIQAFAESMGELCQELDQLIEKRSGRIKQEAENARLAYDRTFSLIDYLLEVKASLTTPSES
jgi:putative hemolysin